MPETFTTQPFAERKSQNLGFIDYAKSTLLWAVFPVVAGAATYAIGRVSKFRIWPLDGSPTLFYHAYESLFHAGARKALGQKVGKIDEVARLALFTAWLPEEKRLAATRNIWNYLKGTEIAIIPTLYHFWRQKEKMRLELEPAYERLKNLNDLKPTDSELKEENASLKTQLAYLQKPGHSPSTQFSAPDTVHLGTVHANTKEKRH